MLVRSPKFPDSVFRLTDNADATKQVAFEASGITTGNTRTMTVPNFDATLATLAGTEQLDNKTLNNPKFLGNAGLPSTPAAGLGMIYMIGTSNVRPGFMNQAGTQERIATSSLLYKFRAYRAAAQNTGAGAFAKVVFDTENFDTNSNFATGTYTVPVAGWYQFNYMIQVGSSSNSSVASLYKNGVEVSRGNRGKPNASLQGTGGGDLLQLAASDTIDVYCYSDGAVALDVAIGSAGNYISGFLVSET